MAAASRKRVETLTGPFDPGGQPDTRTEHPLQLGFFAWNLRGGTTASKAVLEDPDRLHDYWTWPNSRRLVELAERIGFDYQVPFGRWLGWGGETDFNGAALDFLASAAATAPITERMGLFSTAHVTYRFHPLHIAKFGATIDHISAGRWGLNIVSGYSPTEMAAFGYEEPIDHDVAYEMADEFTTLMKHLWVEPEPFDFVGEHYQAYGAYIAPRPTRRPRPILMSAGMSPKGVDFAARNVDWIFTVAFPPRTFADRAKEIHDLSASYGRTVRVATMVWLLADATDELAQEKYEHVVDEIDKEALHPFLDALTSGVEHLRVYKDKRDEPYYGMPRELYSSFAIGISAPQIVGSYQTCAERLKEFYDAGLESVLISFYDPQNGLHQMEDHILPIMRRMGIRN